MQDACAPRGTQRKMAREKRFQPGKKFKLHSAYVEYLERFGRASS